MKGKIYLVMLALVMSIGSAFAFKNISVAAPANVYQKTSTTYILTGCALTGTLACTPPTTGTCKCFYVFVNGMWVLLADNTPLYRAQ